MVTRVDMLTYEQEARLPEWLAEWTARRIAIGLSTEPADWVAFEEGVRRCYGYAGVPWHGRVVRVSSPLVMALAAPIAAAILDRDVSRDDTAQDLIDNAVHREVRDVSLPPPQAARPDRTRPHDRHRRGPRRRCPRAPRHRRDQQR